VVGDCLWSGLWLFIFTTNKSWQSQIQNNPIASFIASILTLLFFLLNSELGVPASCDWHYTKKSKSFLMVTACLVLIKHLQT